MRTGMTIGFIVAGAGVIAVAETFRRKAAESNGHDPYAKCHDFEGLEHHPVTREIASLASPKVDY